MRRDLVAAQVRHVPSYLVPPALQAAGAAPKKSFKRRKRADRAGAKRARGDGADASRRKDNDPLQTFDASGLDAAAAAPAPPEPAPAPAAPEPPRVFDDGDPELSQNQSTAGRVAWKMAHKKGSFRKGGPKKRLKKFQKEGGFRQKKF